MMSRLARYSPDLPGPRYWAVLVVLAAALGLAAAGFGWLPLLAAAVAVGVFIGWQQPRLILLTLLVVVTVIYWFTNDLLLLPDSAKYVKEALIVFLFVRAFAAAVVERTFIRTPLDKWLLLFVALGLLSGLVNQTPLTVIAAALRGLFQY